MRRLLLLLAIVLSAPAGAEDSRMVRIAGGTYVRPLEKNGSTREVAPFLIDVRQVTNAEFLAFVTAHPEWRRSQVKRLHADASYLRHWSGDTELGPQTPPDAPVIHVSWFAARAFLKAAGKRLPTTDEWEFAARADERQADASGEVAFRKRILEWYARPAPQRLPAAKSMPSNYHGIRGMHGLVWEWTLDFVASMAGGESRADGSPDSGQFCGAAGVDPNQAIEYADFMRTAFRSSLQGDFCLAGLGFRGARDSLPGATAPAGDAPASGASLYELKATWANQLGKPVEWSASAGKFRVVALGYATCKGVCPRIIADMQRIEKELDEVARQKLRFTFVTLDPIHDTVAEMKALGERHKVDAARWDLLTGEEDAVLELAVALGIRYNRLPNGIDFAHSYLIAVIGPDGTLLHRWTDSRQGPEAAIQAIQKAGAR